MRTAIAALHGTPFTVGPIKSILTSSAQIADPLVLVTFGATVLLLCAHICPAVSREVIKANFEQSWGECQAVLEHYRVQMPLARQSMQTLQALRGKLFDLGSHGVCDIFANDLA